MCLIDNGASKMFEQTSKKSAGSLGTYLILFHTAAMAAGFRSGLEEAAFVVYPSDLGPLDPLSSSAAPHPDPSPSSRWYNDKSARGVASAQSSCRFGICPP